MLSAEKLKLNIFCSLFLQAVFFASSKFLTSVHGGLILQLKGPACPNHLSSHHEISSSFHTRHALSIFHTSITAAKHLRVATFAFEECAIVHINVVMSKFVWQA
jgi:hypothetical protein